MTIKIDRAKFIEQLAAIKEILVDAYKNDRMHYIVADAKSEVEDSVLFKNGMIEWSNHENECPFCGDPVYIQDSDQLGGPYEIFVCSKCHRQIPNELYEKITYVVSPDGVAEFVKRSLGCKYVHPCGDGNYRLGKLYGRAVYFCASPVEGLYNTHNENVILVVCDEHAPACRHSFAHNHSHTVHHFILKHCESPHLIFESATLSNGSCARHTGCRRNSLSRSRAGSTSLSFGRPTNCFPCWSQSRFRPR